MAISIFTLLCKNYCHPSPEHFSYCKTEIPYLLNNNSPFPLLPTPLNFLSLRIWLLWVPHMSRIMQYLSFCETIFHCMHLSHLVYPFMCQWTLGYFYLRAIVNNAAKNISVQVSLWDPAFDFGGYLPRSELAGSYDNSIFNILWNNHTDFYSSCIILYCHQQCTGILISPHLPQHLFSVLFCFIIAILMNVNPYSFKVSISLIFSLIFIFFLLISSILP